MRKVAVVPGCELGPVDLRDCALDRLLLTAADLAQLREVHCFELVAAGRAGRAGEAHVQRVRARRRIEVEIEEANPNLGD